MTTGEEKAAKDAFDMLASNIDQNGTNWKKVSQVKRDRGYVDGCFDLCHSGHFNAIRQASELVHTLIVGPNSEEEILKHKGPTILLGEERYEIVRAVKWGDEIAVGTPYVPTEALLDELNA